MVVSIGLWRPIARRIRLVHGIFRFAHEEITKVKNGLIQSRPGELDEYYPGGRLKERRVTEGPAKHTRTNWYEGGQKQSEVIFEKNQLLVTRTWTSEGKLASETVYRKGQADVERAWFPSGQLSSETSYDGNGQTVLLKQWQPNGQLRMIVEFKDGSPYKSLQYDPQGHKIGEYLIDEKHSRI